MTVNLCIGEATVSCDEKTIKEKVPKTENVGAKTVHAKVVDEITAKATLNGTADTVRHADPDVEVERDTKEYACPDASRETSDLRENEDDSKETSRSCVDESAFNYTMADDTPVITNHSNRAVYGAGNIDDTDYSGNRRTCRAGESS